MTVAPPAEGEEKPSMFEKMGAGLPVALTAIATILAGMSTGELSRAMYWRSAAAQDQAKVVGQWSLAGFKRDRALICETTADTLKAMNTYREPTPRPKTPDPEVAKRVGAWLKGGDPPADDPNVRAVLQAVNERKAEAEVLGLARKVNPDVLDGQITAALREEAGVE